MELRILSEQALEPALFDGFQRHQEITHCWCKEDGLWQIRRSERTIENWKPEQLEFICGCLRGTVCSGGMAAGAFENGVLAGIVAVEGELFGSRGQYLAVSFLHVSRPLRGKGIGRLLFSAAGEFAAMKGAEKLYISSQPSVQTQAFYRAMGCVEAEEYNPEYVAHNPKECQLECTVRRN